MEETRPGTTYTIRKKFFKAFGASFKIFDQAGTLCYMVSQKAFRLKEDIRAYADEGKTKELLLIQARQIIDFSATYDVFDSPSGAKIGSLRRKGFASMIKDEWLIFDSADGEIGSIKEDSMLLAMLRRFITALIPQTFEGTVGGRPVFTFRQKFNPFIQQIVLDFSPDQENILDRRMGIAAGILICAVEGRQNN